MNLFLFLESVLQHKLNSFERNNTIDTSPTKVHLSKNAHSVTRLENLDSLNTTADLNGFNRLKRNYVSVDILNSAIKRHDKQNVNKKHNECFTEFSINNPIRENKVTVNNDDIQKNEILNTAKAHKIENLSRNLTNVKPAASAKLEKSQFLKMHNSEMLFRDNKYLTQPHLHRIQDAGDIDIFNSKKCIARNGRDSMKAKDNIMHCADTEYKRLASEFPFLTEFNLAKNASKFDKISAKLIDAQTDDLYTIFEDKCITENEKDIIK
jgi:hypothetical protein